MRWQIPRPATCQCLATFTPLKSNILILFRDVISLLAGVFIFLIDRATQEVPMKKYLKEIVGPVFEIYAIGIVKLDVYLRGMTSLTYVTILSGVREYVCNSL